MAAKNDFASYCAELLAGVGAARVRRMFGGHGIYMDDLFVAVVVADTLYLKADAETVPAFQAAGASRFEYGARGRTVSLGFWTPPPEAMDSPALMQPWARLAVAAALRSRNGKPAKARR